MTSLIDFFNQLGIGGAKEPAAQPATTQPAAAPEAPIQPLPKVEAPVTSMQPIQDVQPYQVPKPVLVSKSTSNQSLDKASKADLTQSGINQTSSYNEQGNYIKALGSAQNQAKEQVNAQLGSPEQKSKEYQATVSDSKEKMKADMVELDSKISALKDTQFKDFWADKSTGTKIGMALAVGLGQYGAMMTGSKNVAWDIVQKAMDDDYRAQEANYNRQLKNIEASKLGMDQKQKLIDSATKDFETYQVARSYAVEQKAEEIMKKNGQQLTPALQEAYFKLQQDKEKNAQGLILAKADKMTNQVNSAIQQSQINPELANKMSTDPNTGIGKYNKAIDDYQTVQNFKKSGNYNASVIKLVADGLKQGSYDPSKFDPTTRSLVEKLKDQGEKALGDGEQQKIVKSAEKFFEENAKQSYNDVKNQIPMFKSLGMQHTVGQNPDIYVRSLPKGLSNSMTDLSQSGLKKAP
jgi:hypothetical protein